MAQTRAAATTSAMVPTFSQPMPEKLPRDQLWRLTMLESSAKVTTKSVTAEQILPIMTPQMTRMDIFRALLEIARTKPMEIMEPRKAAAIIPAEPRAMPRCRAKISTRATTSFAPEEMPST